MPYDHSKRARGHANNPELTGEYIYGDMLQLIFLVLFLGVWITDIFFIHFSDFSHILTPFIRIPVGLVILIVSFYIAKTGLGIVFGTEHSQPDVIDYGVFKIVRHPIYLSAIGFYFGLLWIKFSLAATGIWLVTIIMYYLISRYEERLLTNRFGDVYRDYKKRVPMLFPRLF